MARNTRLDRIVLIAGIGFLLMTGLPGAAMAKSSAPTFGSLPPGVQMLCKGDCRENSTIEFHRQAADFDADFSVGLKLLEDGLDLTLETDGNIFIYGGLSGPGPVRLNAKGDLFINGPGPNGGPGIVLPPGLHFPSVIGDRLPIAIHAGGACFCGGSVTLRASPGLEVSVVDVTDRETRGAVFGTLTELAAVAALVGIDVPAPSPPGFIIARSGDVYLDVSMVELGRFTATAGKSIFVMSFAPVPEPGTAMLLGLGLAGLGVRGFRSKA